MNFDEIILRRNTGCSKWDKVAEDCLPLSLADMDFKSAPQIIEQLHHRVEQGVFGYPLPDQDLPAIVVKHFREKYHCEIEPEWIEWLPSVVPALNLACLMVDGTVMINIPIYQHIIGAPIHMRRDYIHSRLKILNGQYTFDFESMEREITPQTKLFILCNPHNPVGRSYTRTELLHLAHFCEEHNLTVCSDEIHCDLILAGGNQHIPFIAVSEYAKMHTLILMSGAKTYNLPGVSCAFAVIPNQELRDRFIGVGKGILAHPGILEYTALKAALRDSGSWYQEMLTYLSENRDYLEGRISNIPRLSMLHPEATYLAWINATQLKVDNPFKYLLEEARVCLSEGAIFGAPGFVRLNFATSRANLKVALDRIETAINKWHRRY
jgi:cysteine-S-conjugate beta-lyase